jgi:hypothetical protein
VAIVIVTREKLEDVYVVTARATLPTGRTDESVGAVTIAGLKGEALANAYMKCETKAKRRVTLSIVGLGMLDETELETIPRKAFGVPPPVVHEAASDPPLLDENNHVPIDPDKDPPPAGVAKELPDFCGKHPKLKDAMGVPFFDLPFESLNVIGDVMRVGMLMVPEGSNKRGWYEWIVNGLLDELAERAAMDGKKEQTK